MSNIQKQHKISPAIAWLTIQKFIIFYCPLDGEHTIVMSFNMGAFMSESIRGALLSVDEGQKEAAYSLGMTNFQLVTRIVIPQAVRVALPPLFNDIINLIKMTSLAFMLGVPDIMGAAKIEGARTFRYFEIYAAVMLVYWLIIFVLGILHKLLEKKCANMY